MRNLRYKRHGKVRAINSLEPAKTRENVADSSHASRSRLSPFYAAGPALSLGTAARVALGEQEGTERSPSPIHGHAAPGHATAFGKARSIRLEGKTDADFGGTTYSTENVTLTQGKGCEGCSGSDCVRAKGTLVVDYRVTTTVTLPKVSDYPDLTPCQKQRIQDAITNVLTPHEQKHVKAFETYNGSARYPFDVTLCRSDFDSTIESMFKAREAPRQASAKAKSAKLDPFFFDVDLDCEDKSSSADEPGEGSEEAPKDAMAETETANSELSEPMV